MKIAIIGFGTLVTNKNTKVNKNKAKIKIGKWQANGPEIPIEFCRVTKLGNLAPVINEKHGRMNKTHFAISKHINLKTAFNEFVNVEKINPNRVGVLDTKNKDMADCVVRTPKAVNSMVKWAQKNKVDAIIFNSLGIKFKEKLGVAFTPNTALNYLKGLNPKTRKVAIAAIKSVPKNITTPLKDLVAINKF